MSRSRTSFGPRRMKMIDLDRLRCDSKNASPLSHWTSNSLRWTRGLSRNNQASMRVSGQFLPPGQTGHGFLEGSSDARLFPGETHRPRAPFGKGKESRPEKQGNPLSLLSLIKESEYPCGLPQDFCGTSGLSQPCPVCPLQRVPVWCTPAGLSGRVLPLGCVRPTSATRVMTL